MSETTKTMITAKDENNVDIDMIKTNINDKFDVFKTAASEKLEIAKTAVAGGFDTSKATVADKLHQAAESLNKRLNADENSNSAISTYGHKAADMLDRSADYVGEFDPNQVKSDVQNHIKKNPGRSLLIAGAVGLILGALFKRGRKS